MGNQFQTRLIVAAVLVVAMAGSAGPGCQREDSGSGTGPAGASGTGAVADPGTATWAAAVAAGDLPAVAAKMRAGGGPAWPAVPSAEAVKARPQAEQDAWPARHQLALALFDKIEAFEWGRQRVDD